MKKQERLNDILLKMYRGEVRVRNLAKLYNVSERTIQNDIKELSTTHNIVSPQRGVYKLENINPIVEKKFEEVFSKFIIKANYDIFPQFEELIRKIEFKTTFKPTELFEINFRVEKLKDNGVLIDLIRAIEWDFTVEFEYKNKKRVIQPLKILNYNAIWYLIGYDLKSNKLKSFKINRVRNLISKAENLLGNKVEFFKKKIRYINTPWIENNKEAICRIYYPLSENVIEGIIKREKTFVDIRIKYYDEREAFDLIKKYLPFIKIMDKELREKMKKFLKKSIQFI